MTVKKKKTNFNILLKIIIILSITVFYFIYKLNVIDIKWIATILITSIISLIFLKVLSKIKSTRFFSFVMGYIIIIVLIIVNIILFKTNDFLVDLHNDFGTEYYVIALKHSKTSSLDNLGNKEVGIKDINDELSSKIKKYNLKIKEYKNTDELINALYNNTIYAAIIPSSYFDLYKDENENFVKNINIIDKISIKNKNIVNSKKVDAKTEPIIVYISGIDTFNDISTSSRSDVNMLAVINTKNKEILLINIPRDYYITIPKFKSKDKLTHAGIYGVGTSIETIENLLDIDINYYIRVNFSFLVQLVDTIGGIDVDSKYTFTTENYNFQSGINHLDGYQALEFVRERKNLPDGDISRGINQQTAIVGIINKLKNKKNLIKYNKILNSLKGNFETNIESEEISILIHETIKDNNWHINSIYLMGNDGMEYTHSYAKQKLYVMIPDKDSIERAKNEISNIIDINN